MANTTTDKLNRLKTTKASILTAIQNGGIEVPAGTPFSSFPTYISQLAPLPQDTTSTEDLMVLADLYREVTLGLYQDKSYSQQEQDNLLDLVNLILEGDIVNE